MATISHQQARHFNAPEVNIALPVINTLHAMPSISHLSSTQTDLAQLNLHYAIFTPLIILKTMIIMIVFLSLGPTT